LDSESSNAGNQGSLGADPDRVEIGAALGALGLGLFLLAGSFSIGLGAGYDRIGPRFFPYLVGFGSLLSGGLLLREAFRGGKTSRPSRGEGAFPTSRSASLTLGFALLSSVLLLERAGFVLTAALLFWLVARAFASARPARDAVSGLVLSLAVYLAFTRGLGLVLPRGLLGGLF
jgi:putative tricarboxylic transport membrane protein